ncbi:MAG: hypothetical protein ACQEUI_12145 [Actinomycetota bacterium]
MHLAAARIDDPQGLIDNTLYWAAVETEDEAHYLCAILNSPKTTELVRPLMSYGKDERHIHKHVWKLPIPAYNPGDHRHQRLADLGHALAAEVAALDLDETTHFPVLRCRIREHLEASPAGIEAQELVIELVS